MWVLDPVAIGELLAIAPSAGAGFCDRICDGLVRGGQVTVAGLRESLTLRDSKAFAYHAHTLKGASAMVGASEVARLCSELERRDLRTAPANALSVEIDDLEIAVAHAEVALRYALRSEGR